MKKGFSLIETVFLIAFTAIVLVALVNLFLIFSSAIGYERVVLATNGSAGSAMNALQSAVLPAKNVLASRSFSGTTYSSSATVLVLEIPGIDAAGNAMSSVSDYYVFYSSGEKLYRLVEVGVGSTRLAGRTELSSSLHALSFTYDNADFGRVTSVAVDLQTRGQYKERIENTQLVQKLYLRNHLPL